MDGYIDQVDLRKLEWIIDNAEHLNLGKSYVKGMIVGGDAQLDIIKKYHRRATMFEGYLPVHYYQIDDDGRRFSKDISLTNLSRPIRHTIAKNMIDIDMKNAHPCLVLWLCKRHGIACDFIEKYVLNRDEMLVDLQQGRGLTRDGAKKMLLRAINRDDGHFQQTENDPDWLWDYHNQCKLISTNLAKHYPEYVAQADKSKKRKDMSSWNLKGSAMNRLLCHHENEILKIVEQKVIEMGGRVCNLAYDGCMISDEHFRGDRLPELLSAIEVEVKKQYEGLIFTMTEKTMDEGFEMPTDYQTKKQRKRMEAIKRDEKRMKKLAAEMDAEEQEQAYQWWKEDFEKDHCKIIDPASIVYKNSLGHYEFVSPAELCQKYSHRTNFPEFIIKWWKDPEMRVYHRADIFAPRQHCPEEVFNLWCPYPLEGKDVEMTPELQEEVDFVLNHIRVLANHDETVYTYFLDWIAQFIQYPHVKTQLIAMISIEGAGKDTFLHIIKGLIGKRQVLETTRPEDIFGRFNSMLANYRFIVLNEMNATDTHKYDKDMKMLITEDTVVIEGKGTPSYTINSFHRLILFTNKAECPIQTSENDRRKLIVRCSDEKIGDGEYFTKLHYLIDKEEVLIALFKMFSTRDIEAFNAMRGRNIPKTEYQKIITQNYSSPVEDWVKHLVHTTPTDDLALSSNQLLEGFNEYCKSNGIHLSLSTRQLGVRLSLLNMEGISTKSSNGSTFRVFKIPLLKTALEKR